MEKQRIVDNLIELGKFFSETLVLAKNNEIEKASDLHKRAVDLIQTAFHHNSWFTPEFVEQAYASWADTLNKKNIEEWLQKYDLKPVDAPRKVGVIMAGNIPMVGLHDALCVLVAGYHLSAKLSSKDNQLMNLCLDVLAQLDEDWKQRIHKVERLNDADLLIATGNDNSARYFEYYFREVPKIIRKNRTSLAILSHEVPQAALEGLARDVFTYFGLGCRNITKVYIPQEFDLDQIFNALYPYKEVANHNQYANNYDYNKAVYLMNKVDLLENGFILLKEDEGLHSPLGVLFYERYNDLASLEQKLAILDDQIQLIASDMEHPKFKKLGQAQIPELWDYADGIDTIDFLINN